MDIFEDQLAVVADTLQTQSTETPPQETGQVDTETHPTQETVEPVSQEPSTQELSSDGGDGAVTQNDTGEGKGTQEPAAVEPQEEEPVVEEENPFLQDFFADPEPGVQGDDSTDEGKPAEIPASFYNDLSQELQLENPVGNKYGLVSYINSLKKELETARQNQIPGLDETIVQAFNDGLLTKEELLTGELLGKYGEGYTNDEIVADMILEDNPNITQEELQDQIEGMSDIEKRSAAMLHKKLKEHERREKIGPLQQKLREKQQQQQQEADMVKEARESLQKNLLPILAKQNEIAGAGVPVNDNMRKAAEMAITDPSFMRKVFYGNDLSNPNLELASQQVFWLLNRKTISNHLLKAGANEEKGKIIRDAQNIDLDGRKGHNVGEGVLTPQQQRQQLKQSISSLEIPTNVFG